MQSVVCSRSKNPVEWKKSVILLHPSMMLPLPLPDDTISSLCTPTRVVLVGNPWASPFTNSFAELTKSCPSVPSH